MLWLSSCSSFQKHQIIEDQKQVLQIQATRIEVILRKKTVLDREKITQSIQKIMPLIQQQMGFSPEKIVLIDSDGPIGGGPSGAYSVAVYSTDNMTPFYAQLVEQATGWPAEKSTMDYIKKYYKQFPDPEQAYIDDIVLHELMHTYLGFGLTKASPNQSDWWFTFGLGLLMDRQIWKKLYTLPSPLFEAPVHQWKNKYSKMKQIDQRLIQPDTKNDQHYNLVRLQIYGHGKAFVYLQNLRKLVGEKLFDQAVKSWVQSRQDLNYDLFIQDNFKSQMIKIQKLEKQFIIR